MLKVKVLVSQSCPTLCDSMHCNPPGSSVHGNFWARILEWLAIPFSRVPDTMAHAFIFSPQLQCKLMESRNCLEVFLSFFVLQPHCLQCLVFCYTLGKVSPKQYFFWICKLMEKWKNTNENVLYSRGNSVLCGELNGKEIQKRGDICISGSLCCTAETNTTL